MTHHEIRAHYAERLMELRRRPISNAGDRAEMAVRHVLDGLDALDAAERELACLDMHRAAEERSNIGYTASRMARDLANHQI